MPIFLRDLPGVIILGAVTALLVCSTLVWVGIQIKAHHIAARPPPGLARPDWAATVDFDAAASTRTRHEVFASLAGQPTLVIGTHFAGPTAGRIVRDGDAYRLEV